ncbi:MAG: GyrI-like domain-containing protein [Saprospiraceae bacterium]
MKKIDLKKEHLQLYKASNTPALITVPKLQYLMVDGQGDPNSAKSFQEAIEALYSMSYTLKFMIKKGAQQIDYGVMPLEGLWWTDDMNDFSMANKAAWKWTIMILQPDFITPSLVEEARLAVAKKKNLPALPSLRLASMQEGLCAQVLYIGPYNQEPPTIIKLHEYIASQGYKLKGKHREIYLNDMRRTAPEKLKTIIRQSVTK